MLVCIWLVHLIKEIVMSLNKTEIRQHLALLGIKGSSHAGALRCWVIENKVLLSDEDCEVVDFNIFSCDCRRVYVIKLVQKLKKIVLQPRWSFLMLTSTEKIPVEVVTQRVILTIQLGTTYEHLEISRYRPEVTSEGGVFVY